MTSNEPEVVSPQMQNLVETEMTICDAQLRAFNHVLDVCFGKPGGQE
jgi:hypothetical protein